MDNHSALKVESGKKKLNSKFTWPIKVLVASLVFSLLSVPASQGSNMSSQIVVKDTFYAARWIYKIDHPAAIDCSWGTTDPRKDINGVACKFTVSISWSWVGDSTAGMRSSYQISPNGSPWVTPTFAIIDSQGFNRTLEDYSFWSESTGKRLYFSASPNQQNLTFVFAYNGPSKVQISYVKSAIIDKDLEEVISGATSFINVNGPTRESVISKLEAEEKAASDKAAVDRAAAASKAAADKVAADAKAASDRAAVQAAQNAKKLTITCKKGSTSKKVTGESPVCPKGLTNSLDKFLTFQAYSKCKLYKKDSTVAGVELLDNGATLKFSYAGKYSSYLASAGSYSDVTCTLTMMKAPSFVLSQIETTRALDGLQKAAWGKSSAFWTYHPDNGLNISFNTK